MYVHISHQLPTPIKIKEIDHRQRLTVKLPKTGYTDIEISHAPSCCILGNVKTSAVKEKSGFR